MGTGTRFTDQFRMSVIPDQAHDLGFGLEQKGIVHFKGAGQHKLVEVSEQVENLGMCRS